MVKHNFPTKRAASEAYLRENPDLMPAELAAKIKQETGYEVANNYISQIKCDLKSNAPTPAPKTPAATQPSPHGSTSAADGKGLAKTTTEAPRPPVPTVIQPTGSVAPAPKAQDDKGAERKRSLAETVVALRTLVQTIGPDDAHRLAALVSRLGFTQMEKITEAILHLGLQEAEDLIDALV